MAYTFPTDLDNADELLARVGSIWTSVFAADPFMPALLEALARIAIQNQQGWAELFAAMSRHTMPVAERRLWMPWVIRQSEKNLAGSGRVRHGDVDLRYGDTTYGSNYTSRNVWASPPRVLAVPLIANAIYDPTVALVHQLDFVIEPDAIVFRTDPFANTNWSRVPVYEDGAIVDWEITLWLLEADLDQKHMYRQFGYLLGPPRDSSQAYSDLINAALDGIVDGPTLRSTHRLLSAATGIPLARKTEPVDGIYEDDNGWIVTTTTEAYRFTSHDRPNVVLGQVVQAGESMSEGLRIFELGRGEAPARVELQSLALSQGMLGPGYLGELVFLNQTQNWLVSEDSGGRTKMEFAVFGFPGDVERFWETTHTRGVAAGTTLARLLDTRANADDEPGWESLPREVNPVEFLCENVLRNNVAIVRVRPKAFGPLALGLHHLRLLRKILPPHTMVMLMIELEMRGTRVTLDTRGTTTAVGGDIEMTSLPCQVFATAIDGDSAITNRIRLIPRQGRCL